jgi:2,4-dienoyl-CoA reductase-like NADH-dependent reductase (Old Yellow Enzyme family)
MSGFLGGLMLFEPFRIKSLEIPNRFVRSATYDGCAEKNGHVSERQIALYEALIRCSTCRHAYDCCGSRRAAKHSAGQASVLRLAFGLPSGLSRNYSLVV